MNAGVPGRQLRVRTPAAVLTVGILILVMLALTAVMSSIAHQSRLSGLGEVAI